MKGIVEPLLEIQEYSYLVKRINNDYGETASMLVSGLVDAEKNHVTYGIKEHTKKPMLILTYSEISAKQIYEDMKLFYKNIITFPPKDILFYSADIHSMAMNRQRSLAIEKIINNEIPILVLSIETLQERYVKKEIFEKFIINIKLGDTIEIDSLIKDLVCLGYERVEQVEAIGQFSIRGGIIDIFSIVADDCVRIEFWDDEIDSIRTMDITTQRSMDKIEETKIFPMNELVYEEEQIIKASEKILKEAEKTIETMRENGHKEREERVKFRAKEDGERLLIEKNLSHISSYISYFYEDTVSLIDYLPKDTLVIFHEPTKIREHMTALGEEYRQGMEGRITEGYLLGGQGDILFSYEDIIYKLEKYSKVFLSTISSKVPDYEIEDSILLDVKSNDTFNNNIEMFYDDLILKKKKGYRIIILGGNTARCKRIVNELGSVEIEAYYKENLDEVNPFGSIVVTRGNLSKSFEYPNIKLSIFSSDQIFSVKEEKKKLNKKKKGKVLESFTDLKIGDYVVHDNHGVGQYLGLEKITIDNVKKDYMKITYRDGGNLFVSVNQMSVVQKFIGKGSNAPRLNKLGGVEWEKAKARTRATVRILAEDLVALYAKRQATKGYAFPEDTQWQNEFESAFIYSETDDQLSAIDDVKSDMESSKVMDRLICGDVGYGKTEVAIRAAFKAVQHGKQVAFLVPTTILAQQHFRTFQERMESYPIQVELLSRFRTPKEQKISINNMKTGMGDIVVGTHRLLSKDIEFKDLGLMIIDEEQRFGVSHKEKIKRIKSDVDVLTLSATPIPRTLHMSLSGIRDMSLLEDPPRERHPIQTYVMENNPEFVREAINREIARGGQAYYLYNRVESIEEETLRLEKLVPNANITFAHGQMKERELEKIMNMFLQGEIDVLVCTTIIETGMDISNANTIIIQDADNMGLSQLYQLRGRVGRSNRIAYAYLLYRPDKMLREVAEKRLQTIREFTEFGAGFKIALRDLEIRGAGNILGAEQHGHMEAIGYDMYCRLLEEEVLKIQHGEDFQVKEETLIDINVNAFISEKYILNQQQRMEIYKKIALITNVDEYYQIQEELEDRYGDLPKVVATLLDIALIRSIANKLGIIEIKQKSNIISFYVGKNPNINLIEFTELLKKYPNKYKLFNEKQQYFTMILEKKTSGVVNKIKILLNSIKL